ncbi:formate/nitrite transporter family protein [Puniceicoccus vermicola]|uniref:Formate/nitrite transporter family protein n=1 Tax=Puniceicoccus vermicola TaxID=388746 RepID=A0A7X1AWH3_9BACT|nr:formate/nitrite transporter family protein [Puniceicoccus vermicola]MBC2601286.1 formate/nitrite transporter family protein [Puniceicoccus vermicola]
MKKSEEKEKGLSRDDQSEVQERSGLRSPVIYEVVRQEGYEELSRPVKSLCWSGFAAGVALSFSIYCKAFLSVALQDVPAGEALSNLGYTVGFVIVVLGRMQLFTENTITAVLPLFADFRGVRLYETLRLWGIVFLTNMLGSFASALGVWKLRLLPDEKIEAVVDVSRHLAEYSFWENLAYGVPAGFLVAAIVWLMPGAKQGGFWIVVLLSFMIPMGGLTHVVAGSTEWFFLALDGEVSWATSWGQGIFPTLLGNILGGTGMFAVICYGQVQDEL